jgi:hypothetical protein
MVEGGRSIEGRGQIAEGLLLVSRKDEARVANLSRHIEEARVREGVGAPKSAVAVAKTQRGI